MINIKIFKYLIDRKKEVKKINVATLLNSMCGDAAHVGHACHGTRPCQHASCLSLHVKSACYVMSHAYLLLQAPYLIGSYVSMPHVHVIMLHDHIDIRMSNLVPSPTKEGQKSLKQCRADTAQHAGEAEISGVGGPAWHKVNMLK